VITKEQYIGVWSGSPDWTPERQGNADVLLAAVAALEAEMVTDGVVFPDNPKTGSGVSGEVYGGFRPQSCPIGAPHSNHKEGRAVDRFDPGEHIDDWCMAHQDRLKFHGIYIEHPSATPGWSHWQSVPPGSGHTVFYP
jgi:hypothetical protein